MAESSTEMRGLMLFAERFALTFEAWWLHRKSGRILITPRMMANATSMQRDIVRIVAGHDQFRETPEGRWALNVRQIEY